MPSWLLILLKQHLKTEHHHKVLRRLLHLLATLPTPSVPAPPDTPLAGSQSNSKRPDNPAHQHITLVGHQHITSSAASHAGMPDRLAGRESDATAASVSVSVPSAPVAPSTARQPPTAPAAAAAQTAVVGTSDSCAVVDAMRQSEQICTLMTQACHPSVKREALQCLGAAAHAVVAALTPFTHQLASEPPDAWAHTEQPADRPPQQLGQSQSKNPEIAGREDSGWVAAELRCSLRHEAELRDSDSNPAHLRDAATSRTPLEISGLAQFQIGASGAQRAEHEEQQRAYGLLDGFVTLVSSYSQPWQFDDMRLAAATALAVSGSDAMSSHDCIVHACTPGSHHLSLLTGIVCAFFVLDSITKRCSCSDSAL